MQCLVSCLPARLETWQEKCGCLDFGDCKLHHQLHQKRSNGRPANAWWVACHRILPPLWQFVQHVKQVLPGRQWVRDIARQVSESSQAYFFTTQILYHLLVFMMFMEFVTPETHAQWPSTISRSKDMTLITAWPMHVHGSPELGMIHRVGEKIPPHPNTSHWQGVKLHETPYFNEARFASTPSPDL